MLKKKRKLEKNLSVNVILVLILTVMCACKKEKPSIKLHFPQEYFYTYYKNFKIVGIRMNRVYINGVPSTRHTLYILETYIEGCNPERRYRDPELLGRRIFPYDGGLNDTIYKLEFTCDHKTLSPKPLHWSPIGENVNCEFNISEVNNNKRIISTFYNGDYEHLPLDISRPPKYKKSSYYSIKGNKDTLSYLITFGKGHQLPDSAIIVFPGKDIKTKIDNSTIKKYSLISNVYFSEPEDSINKKLKEIREKRAQRNKDIEHMTKDISKIKQK